MGIQSLVVPPGEDKSRIKTDKSVSISKQLQVVRKETIIYVVAKKTRISKKTIK